MDDLAEHLDAVRAENDGDLFADGAGPPAFDDLDVNPDGDPANEPRGPAHALLHHLRCGVCSGPAGAQVGRIWPGDEVICPQCVGAIDDLNDAAADDEDR